MSGPTVGSLFSGIGGIDLGLERAGFEIGFQCEIDPWCRRVLAKHWPGVPRYEDVRELDGSTPRVDVLAGGFPCQDLSYAGRGAGIDGERSGLWSEFARVIGELRPRFVLVENVPALLTRGLGRVLGDLAACGYDAEWDCIPASAVGAPHRRDRIWIVAYAEGDGRGSGRARGSFADGAGEREPERSLQDVAYADRPPGNIARAAGETVRGPGALERPGRCGRLLGAADVADADCQRLAHVQGCEALAELQGIGPIDASGWWNAEPDVGRVADGVPHRMDRLRGLGNAVVPAVVEWIGEQIMGVLLEGVSGERRPIPGA